MISMKNPVSYLLLAATVFLLTDCKKTKDDPIFSIYTRKERVVGEWTLKSGTENEGNTSGNYSEGSNTVYAESSYVTNAYTTQNGVTYSSTQSGSYSLKISFKKNGDFSMTKIQDGDIVTESGTWNFTGDIGKHKNKQQIVVNFTGTTTNGSTLVQTGNRSDITFDIKELRNKKMVLTYSNIYSQGNSTNSDNFEWTLEQ
jgi:hypothetical protein